jgi:outer membrane protein TolC
MTSHKTLVNVAFVLAVWLWAFGAPAAAQGIAPLRLSLQEAEMRAVAASHRLAEAQARAAAAEATVELRDADDRPIIRSGAYYQRTRHVTPFVVIGAPGGLQVLYPDIPDNYLTRLDFQWPIFDGGQTRSSVRPGPKPLRRRQMSLPRKGICGSRSPAPSGPL